MIVIPVSATQWTTTGTHFSGDREVKLDPGQIVVITFDVSVDATIPANVTQVCNQGLLTASNHGDVLTDDVSVGGSQDPTCTSVPQADLRIEKSDSSDPVEPGDAANRRQVGAMTGLLIDIVFLAAVKVRTGNQFAVQAVAPGVIGADEFSTVPGFANDLRAPVAAYIVERPHILLLVPD